MDDITYTRMFEAAVRAEVKSLLATVTYRSFYQDGKTYVLDLELSPLQDALVITTWGYDYKLLPIPQDYTDLVMLHTKAHLGMLGREPGFSRVATRFYYGIKRRYADACDKAAA